MRVGVFADCHDHLDHIRKVVIHCNQAEYDLVLFAGDLVSTFAIPPLRKLKPRFIGCFGDNEGNKIGIYGGMQIIGTFGEPPFGIELADGTRVLLTHQKELLRDSTDGADIVVFGHTHKPLIRHDAEGRLFLNPGETSGWTYGRPTMAWFDTHDRSAEIIDLEAVALEA